MKALSITPARRYNAVTILTGPLYGAQLSTRSRRLSWRKAASAIFGARASYVVSVVAILAMWFQSAITPDTVGAQSLIATYLCLAMPWMCTALYHINKKNNLDL